MQVDAVRFLRRKEGRKCAQFSAIRPIGLAAPPVDEPRHGRWMGDRRAGWKAGGVAKGPTAAEDGVRGGTVMKR